MRIRPREVQTTDNAAKPQTTRRRRSSKQRHLRWHRRRWRQGHCPIPLRSEEQPEVSSDPFLRLAEVAELALLFVEAAVVAGAEDVVQVLVVDHRLDEKRRDLRRIEERVDADLGGDVVVRAEADRAALLARDLLAP